MDQMDILEVMGDLKEEVVYTLNIKPHFPVMCNLLAEDPIRLMLFKMVRKEMLEDLDKELRILVMADKMAVAAAERRGASRRASPPSRGPLGAAPGASCRAYRRQFKIPAFVRTDSSFSSLTMFSDFSDIFSAFEIV